jgi:glycerol-3-phosphate acyltransferase PlsY
LAFLDNTNIQFYLLAYFLGSIPFGMILARVFGKVNIKKEGSGNIGATNVLRVLKIRNPKLAKKLAVATLILDALKGVVVLVLANMAGLSENAMWTIAVLAVIGHCFSFILFFEGGKGVATGLGVLAYLVPLVALVGVIVWAFSAKVLKISSLASLLGVGAGVASSFYFYPSMAHAPIVFIGLVILYKHADNIYRLVTRQEEQIA